MRIFDFGAEIGNDEGSVSSFSDSSMSGQEREFSVATVGDAIDAIGLIEDVADADVVEESAGVWIGPNVCSGWKKSVWMWKSIHFIPIAEEEMCYTKSFSSGGDAVDPVGDEGIEMSCEGELIDGGPLSKKGIPNGMTSTDDDLWRGGEKIERCILSIENNHFFNPIVGCQLKSGY